MFSGSNDHFSLCWAPIFHQDHGKANDILSNHQINSMPQRMLQENIGPKPRDLLSEIFKEVK